MTTRDVILQLLQTKNSDCIENKELIIKLIKNGEIDKLISEISGSKLIKLINFKLFDKNCLNCVEQFVVNLDAFINYYSEKLLVGESYKYVLASIFLKSKYSRVLLSNKFIYDGGNNQQYYYLNFKKMMTEQFLNNLMIMRIYIYKYLKNTNLYLERLNYGNEYYNLVFELLVSLFLTNRSNLLVIISNMLINIRRNYIFNNKKNDQYLKNLGIIWQSVFENFQNKFYYVYHLFKMRYLKYTSKNNLINNSFYNLLLRVEGMFYDRIQVIVSDKVGNIICENNPKYIKTILKKINITNINKSLQHKQRVRLSKLNFNDGAVLQNNILVVPVYHSTFTVGYILFVLSDKIIDKDKKYINLILNI